MGYPANYLIVHLDLKKKLSNRNTWLQQSIPSECFEWKGGVRQTLFILIPFWVIGLCTSFFIGSVPITLFILGIIPFSFYEPNSKSPSVQIFSALGITCGIIPLLLPVIWLLSIRFYFKSKENLNIYLNDYN